MLLRSNEREALTLLISGAERFKAPVNLSSQHKATLFGEEFTLFYWGQRSDLGGNGRESCVAFGLEPQFPADRAKNWSFLKGGFVFLFERSESSIIVNLLSVYSKQEVDRRVILQKVGVSTSFTPSAD